MEETVVFFRKILKPHFEIHVSETAPHRRNDIISLRLVLARALIHASIQARARSEIF